MDSDNINSSFNIDADKIEDKITDKTKAIIPVHLFGQCADMDKINKIANENDLIVIEDAAQALGSSYKNKKAGNLGDIGCFSFFPTKNLGGAGDGGIITTNNSELYELMLKLRNHGAFPKYYHEYIGGNFRLDAIQAAIISVKLKYLDKWINLRINNADIYDNHFRYTMSKAIPPYRTNHKKHTFNQYVILVENRLELVEHLNNNCIPTNIYYPVPLHLQKCFKHLGYKNDDMPISEFMSKNSLALPIYPEFSGINVYTIVEKINKFYK